MRHPRVLAALADDVDWAERVGRSKGARAFGSPGLLGVPVGRDRSLGDALGLRSLPGGRVGVDVDRTVRGRDGTLFGLGRVRHLYEPRDEPVVRMDG